MDATAYRALAGIQSCNGLYAVEYLVLWKDLFPDIHYHVVQVDLSAIEDRSIAEPGMEIFIANKYVQSFVDNGGGDIGVALLR